MRQALSMRTILFSIFIFVASWSFSAPLSFQDSLKRPKLVVVIVVDQLRADYLTRLAKLFVPANGKKGVGGFRYLMEKGAYFPNAQYDILQSMTGPGHATILTGAYPYQFGVPMNEWYDKKSGRYVYCVDDDKAPWVPATANTDGGSPRRLLAPTVGDELILEGYPSRVVAISLKDRSAIFLGGRAAHLALWFDQDGFRWVTSTYYQSNKKLPTWVENLNQKVAAERNRNYIWESKGKDSGLSSRSGVAFRDEAVIDGKTIMRSPLGNELTLRAAEQAVRSIGLGESESTDVLAVSLSPHDYLGHKMGANSREMEEMTLKEDQQLADFFRFLDKAVPGGLRNVTIALTGDHGVSPAVDWTQKFSFDSARINYDKLLPDLETRMVKKFGSPGTDKKWIAAARSFNFYFDSSVLQARGVTATAAEAELKSALLANGNFAFVFTRSEYSAGNLPPGQHARQIQHTYVPEKSGDVVAIPKPYVFEDHEYVTHMTGYNYDRTVPLLLAGPNLRAGVYPQMVEIVDIAPTLSFLLGLLPPALSEGRILHEAVGAH